MHLTNRDVGHPALWVSQTWGTRLEPFFPLLDLRPGAPGLDFQTWEIEVWLYTIPGPAFGTWDSGCRNAGRAGRTRSYPSVDLRTAEGG